MKHAPKSRGSSLPLDEMAHLPQDVLDAAHFASDNESNFLNPAFPREAAVSRNCLWELYLCLLFFGGLVHRVSNVSSSCWFVVMLVCTN